MRRRCTFIENRIERWCLETWSVWFERTCWCTRFPGQFESLLLGGHVRVESSGGKKATLLDMAVNMKSRNTLRIGAISLEQNSVNRLSLNGDGCKSNQEKGKDSFGNAIHDKFQGNDNDRAIDVCL